MSTDRFPRTRTAVEHGIRLAWQTGAQVYASIGGATVIDFAIGEARSGVAMERATLVEWASATKPITCAAAALLWQRGMFDLDDPVCRHLPEFSTSDKRRVTIRHLLTHSAGLSEPKFGQGLGMWDEYAAAARRAPLMAGWVPGKRCAYGSAAMWVVASLVVRLTKQPFWRFVRESLFEPLGLRDSWIGMPSSVYREYVRADRIAVLPGSSRSGTEAWVTLGAPSSGGHGPIHELGRFYAATLQRKPPFPLSPPVIEAMTTRHLCGAYDERLKATVDRGLGFQLGSSFPGHGYGPYASTRAFGHGGGTWLQALADPDYILAVAVYLNGRGNSETPPQRRPALLGAVYEDLGLA